MSKKLSEGWYKQGLKRGLKHIPHHEPGRDHLDEPGNNGELSTGAEETLELQFTLQAQRQVMNKKLSEG